ncbi:hypothetical protein RYX36_017301 [Vicia faba]
MYMYIDMIVSSLNLSGCSKGELQSPTYRPRAQSKGRLSSYCLLVGNKRLTRPIFRESEKNIMSKKEADGIEKEFDLGLEPSPLVPDGIVDFLLQNSPSAKVDFVDGRKQKPLRRGHL